MPHIVSNIIEVSVFSFDNNVPMYLLLRRSKSETIYPDIWQIVTGSIEPGETALAASLRELKEETGYIPSHYWIVPHVNTFYSVQYDVIHQTVIFAAQVPAKTDPVLSDEHYQFGWYPFEEAKKMLIWPGQVQALEIIHEYIIRGKEAEKFSRIQL
jgi:dATP pyrophosphohydrolase